MNVAHLLSDSARERSSAAALIEGAGRTRRLTTFGDLDRLARRIAAQLIADGVRAGESVLFFAPPSRTLYAALAATWRVGAVAMFVEPSAGRWTLDAACRLRRPAALIASPRAQVLRLTVPALRAIPRTYHTGAWCLGASALDGGRAAIAEQSIVAVAPDDEALLTFTSGSTGEPKGAIRTHGILRAQLDALRESVAAHAGERELVTLPIVVLLNLAIGAATVLPDADLRRPGAIDPAPLLAQIRREQVQRITASPAFLERLLDAPHATESLRDLTHVVTGGGPVFPDLVERLRAAAPGATITSVYGSTEAEPIAHLRHDEMTPADRQAMESGRGLLAGRPDAAVQLRILSSVPGVPLRSDTARALDAITLGVGEAGEIVVAGPHVVAQYVNGVGEAETKSRVGGVVWHRTGDLGAVDEAGRLWLLGRATAAGAGVPFHPFAVECSARLTLGARRVAALVHNERRLLVLEGRAGDSVLLERARAALAWAELDAVLVVRWIPVDRRHNSKVDYPALQRLLSRSRRL